jgi:hypothetical protein
MTEETAASERIDAKIANLGDWRGAALAQLRGWIRDADPEVIEAVKWAKPSNPAGVPVWEHAGMICTGEVYKSYVKLTFAQGASIDDVAGLFNAGFAGGTRRAINVYESGQIDVAAFKELVQEAVAFNLTKRAAGRTKASNG